MRIMLIKEKRKKAPRKENNQLLKIRTNALDESIMIKISFKSLHGRGVCIPVTVMKHREIPGDAMACGHTGRPS